MQAGERLIRDVRRWDLVAIAINGIIGASIFALPSKVYALTGVYSVLAFLVCGLLTGFIILCFAEVSSRFAETGGTYLYAETCFGPVIGFEVGWLMFVNKMVGFAAVCNLLVSYVAFFVPTIAVDVWRVLFILGICAALTFINLVGVRASAVTTDIFTIGKLVPLVLFIFAGLFFIKPANYSAPTIAGYRSFSTAVMWLVFAFGGFEFTTVTAGESYQPRRNLPFALINGVVITAVVYLLIQVVCIGTLPDLANSQRPLADASRRFLGDGGAVLVAIAAIVSMVGNLNGTILGVPRVPFAMAERGHLPSILAATHKRFRTPHVAILLSSFVIFVLTLSHSFMSALTFAALVRLIIWSITALSMLALRSNSGGRAAAFKVKGGIFVATISMLLCVWLISSSGWREIRGVSAAAAIGLLVYFASKLPPALWSLAHAPQTSREAQLASRRKQCS